MESDKEFWNREVLFTSKDNSLTRGRLEYLEARLIQMAHKSHKADVVNRNDPVPILPEHERAVMDEFLEQMQLLIKVACIK